MEPVAEFGKPWGADDSAIRDNQEPIQSEAFCRTRNLRERAPADDHLWRVELGHAHHIAGRLFTCEPGPRLRYPLKNLIH